MSERKGWGSTVLGWFVVQEGGTPGPAARPDEPPAGRPRAPRLRQGASRRAGRAGGLPERLRGRGRGRAKSRRRVAKAAELLAALPAGTDAAVKKQIVEASLKAFGVPDRQDHRGRGAGDPGAGGLHPRRRRRHAEGARGVGEADHPVRRRRSGASGRSWKAARRSSRPSSRRATRRSSGSRRSSSSSGRRRWRASSATRRSSSSRSRR